MKRARELLLLVALVLSALAILAGGRTAATGAIFVDNSTVGGNTFTTAASFGCGGIACDDFESGGWSGGEGWLWGWWHWGDSSVTTSGSPYEGTYHLRLGSSTGYVDRVLDLSGQSDVHLQFWAKVDSFEAGDFIDLLVGPSGSMTVVRTWTSADSDNTYHFEDIDLSSHTMSSEFHITFDAEMSSSWDRFYVDDLVIKVVPPTPTPTPTPTPGPSWWDSNYSYRQSITIAAGSSPVPSDYSVSVTLDHADLVSAGKSQADGNDVRVLYWNGSGWLELDRVLDDGSAWNNASTRIWFTTQAAISANSSDNNYHLYYGNPAAVTPPVNRANIYLFFDDFEAGNLNKWTADGLWSVATDQRHGGTYSAKYPAESVSLRYLVANPALDVDNVYVDAWQRLSSVSNNGVNQILRKASGAQSSYVTSVQNSSGWDISKEIGGAYTQLSAPAGTASPNTWTRIGIGIYGSGVRVFKNGTQINPASGSYNVGTQLASGNIGLEKVWVAWGNSWWVDDVTVRHYVYPEPSTALGSEEPAP